MKKSSKKTVLVFACIFVLMSCLVLVSALDVGGIRAKAAEVLYAAGDINGDGEVNGKDLTRLSKFMAGLNPGTVGDQLDTNKDGSINSNDITHLMRYLAGEIPELSETVYHTINFYDDITGYTNTVYYSENAGYGDFPVLNAKGRDFKGWSTEDNDIDGKYIITSIPKGSKETYNLHACWTLKSYNITYRKINETENEGRFDLTYTIEDEFEIPDPVYSGLHFSHWEVTGKPQTGKVNCYVDSNYDRRTRIEKGTTGNIELTAKWALGENRVVPKRENRKMAFDYDEKEEVYYFFYELGTIQNIVLNEEDKKAVFKKEGAYGHEFKLTESLTIETTQAKTIAKTIATSVSKSSEWSDVTADTDKTFSSAGIDLTTGLKVGSENYCQASFEASFNYETGTEHTLESTKEVGGGTTEGEENGKEISSSLAYRKELTTVSELTQTIDASAPNGTYSFVHAADVSVYAFVVYDPATKTLSFDTHSILDNMHTVLLFEPNENIEYVSSELAYNIPSDDILETIKSCYYVKYLPNGGEGTMKMSLHGTGSQQALNKNTYEREGYTFLNWKSDKEHGSQVFANEAIVKDIAVKGETISLYAQWIPNTYEISLDVNGGNELLDGEKITVKYDSVYGPLPVPERKGYTFTGWKLGEEIIDINTRVNTARNHTLVASWEAKTYNIIYNFCEDKIYDVTGCDRDTDIVVYDSENIKLAVPYSNLYKFEGWYTSADGGRKLSEADGSVSKWDYIETDYKGRVQLYARWSTDYKFIRTVEELKAIGKNEETLAGNYALLNDIDLSDEPWYPIGNFTGNLEGNRRTIKGLNYNGNVGKELPQYGLFNKLLGANVRNITFTDVDINIHHDQDGDYYFVGALAGASADATISNITVSGQIRFPGTGKGEASVGGVSGYARSCVFSRCTNNASLYATKEKAHSGGIVSHVEGTVDKKCIFYECTNTGRLETEAKYLYGWAMSGGIVAASKGRNIEFYKCSNTGALSVSAYVVQLGVKGDLIAHYFE